MDIDQFYALAERRRSVRRFKPDPVPDEYITKIIDTARWAMSGSNGQPWEFIVVKDREIKAKLDVARGESQKLTVALESTRVPEMRQPRYRKMEKIIPKALSAAPVIIVICGDPRTAQASVLSRLNDRRWVVDENIANATQMIHLAAAACDLGSQWVTIDGLFESLIKPILGVPDIIKLFSMVPIGYPYYKPKIAYRRELEEIVHYEKYDMSKYRSHEDVQKFILKLRKESERHYPLKMR